MFARVDYAFVSKTFILLKLETGQESQQQSFLVNDKKFN